MGIDAGTGSVRAVIFDTQGNQISSYQREWHHAAEVGIENSMAFMCYQNWELTKECINGAIMGANIDPSLIAAVSATSMREGIVLYDEKGVEIWAVANVDARADKEVKFIKEHHPDLEQQFYKKSGQTFALGALPRLLWLKNNHPEVYENVACMTMISDWILYKLSGILASEPSNAGTTGVFDLKKRKWAKKMAKKIGLKSSIFPPVFETSEVIGQVVSGDTMLTGNTTVVMGGGDVQLGSAGLGVTKVGDVAILGGSFWQQVVNMDKSTKPPTNMAIRINPHVIADQSQAEGITFFSGLVARWFRDAFCDKEKELAYQRGVDTYTILEEMASSIPVGSNGILPIFSDSMKYGKWYHASPGFVGLSIDPTVCNKASMFRSLMENACIVSSINLQKIEQFSGITPECIVFAGGASKGFLWPQILSNVTGKIVKIPKVTEATALGAAMAAGVGAGIYEDMQNAADTLIQWDREYQPDMEAHKLYQEIQIKWQLAYAAQIALVDSGITEPMWKAPGI
jgi:autoinducer 2 (AI-2) kinase